MKALLKWQFAPYPPTVDKVDMVVAALHVGIYRSASSYLGQCRTDSERAGYDLGDPIRRAFKYMTRSCTRGLGRGRRAWPCPCTASPNFRRGGNHGPLADQSIHG